MVRTLPPLVIPPRLARQVAVYRSWGPPGRPERIGAGILDKAGVRDDAIAAGHGVHGGSLLVLRGRGRYHDDQGCSGELRAGTLVHRLPERKHSIILDPDSAWLEAFVLPGAAVFCALLATGAVDPQQPVVEVGQDLGWADGVLALMETIERAAESALPALSLRLALHLAELATRPSGRGARSADVVDAACARLAAAAASRSPVRALAEVAHRHGLSYERLRKLFRERTGLSPAAWRVRRRIDQARSLLLAGSSPQSVARRLGYPSLPAFSHQFRQQVGVPPRTWIRPADQSL